MAKKMILSEKELEHLSDVIGEAESHTSGEIRLMIVKRSFPLGHILPTVWLVLVCLGLMVLWFMRDHLQEAPWWLLPSLLVGSSLAAWPLARLQQVQRFFVNPLDMRQAVWMRAELEFHREGLSHTQGNTGILLFLSLLERHAVVLADRGISARLEANTWDGVVSLIQAGAKSGHWKERLEEAIRLCGRLLAEHFPAESHGENQLPNAVIVKD